MAKIKITENELKQIIRESVEGVLNENWFDNRRANKAASRKETFDNAKTNYENALNDPNATDFAKRQAQKKLRRAMGKNGEAAYADLRAMTDKHNALVKQYNELLTAKTATDKQVQTLTGENNSLKQQVNGLTTQLAQAKAANQKLIAQQNAAAKPVAPTNTPVQQQGQQNRPATAPGTVQV